MRVPPCEHAGEFDDGAFGRDPMYAAFEDNIIAASHPFTSSNPQNVTVTPTPYWTLLVEHGHWIGSEPQKMNVAVPCCWSSSSSSRAGGFDDGAVRRDPMYAAFEDNNCQFTSLDILKTPKRQLPQHHTGPCWSSTASGSVPNPKR